VEKSERVKREKRQISKPFTAVFIKNLILFIIIPSNLVHQYYLREKCQWNRTAREHESTRAWRHEGM